MESWLRSQKLSLSIFFERPNCAALQKHTGPHRRGQVLCFATRVEERFQVTHLGYKSSHIITHSNLRVLLKQNKNSCHGFIGITVQIYGNI